jgi:pentatricopeptide repeat protein
VAQGNHCKPDAHTYSTLIDACTRAEQPGMALKVYARAMASQVRHHTLHSCTLLCRQGVFAVLSFAQNIRSSRRHQVCCVSMQLQWALTKCSRSLPPQVNDNLVLYDAAISACKSCPESVDVQEAMRIYADMQRCLLPHRNLATVV